jgi:hypothetical protein
MLARRRGVGQQESGHAVRVTPVQLQCDLPAHRQPGHDGTRYAQAGEQAREVVREGRPTGNCSRARTVAAQVGHDHPASDGELPRLRAPHGPIERVAVHEKQRRAALGPCVVVGQGRLVERDRGHCGSSRWRS